MDFPTRTQLGVGAGIVGLIWACGGGAAPSSKDGGDVGDDASSANDVGQPTFDEASVPSDTGTADASGNCCPANAQYIYVMTADAKLYSFWPPTFTFKLVGPLTCTTSPTHMTVDRNGNAWVKSATGSLYQVSTLTAKCSLVPKWKTQSGFEDFALSFVGLTCADTSLYMVGWTTGELARFDTAQGTFTPIGTPTLAGTNGDMTSNGDGTLYFLSDAQTLHLYELDPSTAAVMKTYTIPNATGGGDQALAYFGGKFYAFENNGVYEYDATANTTKNIGTAPVTVIGAGQSTCVPTEPTDAGPPIVN